MLSAIQLLSRHGPTDIHVHGDCAADIFAADGVWHSNPDRRFGRIARALNHFIWQQAQVKVEVRHVKAHHGHAWNEAADALAWAVVRGWVDTWSVETTLAPLTLDGKHPHSVHVDSSRCGYVDLCRQTLTFDL